MLKITKEDGSCDINTLYLTFHGANSLYLEELRNGAEDRKLL